MIDSHERRDFYAIRHIATRRLMPQLSANHRFGHTWVPIEEWTAGQVGQQTPRVFPRESAAKKALTWYLRGQTSTKPAERSTGRWAEFDEDAREMRTEFQPDRKREDFEIITLTLEWVV